MKRLSPAELLQQKSPAVWSRHALTSAGRQATINHRGVTFSIACSSQILQQNKLRPRHAHFLGGGWCLSKYRSLNQIRLLQNMTNQLCFPHVSKRDERIRSLLRRTQCYKGKIFLHKVKLNRPFPTPRDWVTSTHYDRFAKPISLLNPLKSTWKQKVTFLSLLLHVLCHIKHKISYNSRASTSYFTWQPLVFLNKYSILSFYSTILHIFVTAVENISSR